MGSWKRILTDNGKTFISKSFEELLRDWGIKHEYNAYYHSQNNPAERVNRVINETLRSCVDRDHRSWDKFIYLIQRAINSAVHDSTSHSPYFVMFGKEMPLSEKDHEIIDINREINTEKQLENSHINKEKLFDEVRNNLKNAYEKFKSFYNLRTRPQNFKIGDEVYKKNYVLSNKANNFSAKLAPRKIKCRITEKIGSNTYRLATLNGKDIGLFNGKDLFR